METVREMQKRDLVKDIEVLIAEQRAIVDDAMHESVECFMSAKAYRNALDRAAEANFNAGFLGSVRKTIDGMDVERSVLLIRYHSQSLKEQSADSEDYMSYAYHSLAGLLEDLADTADERKEQESFYPMGRYGAYHTEDMDMLALIGAFPEYEDAREVALGESKGFTTYVFDRETRRMMAVFRDGEEINPGQQFHTLSKTA